MLYTKCEDIAFGSVHTHFVSRTTFTALPLPLRGAHVAKQTPHSFRRTRVETTPPATQHTYCAAVLSTTPFAGTPDP